PARFFAGLLEGCALVVSRPDNPAGYGRCPCHLRTALGPVGFERPTLESPCFRVGGGQPGGRVHRLLYSATAKGAGGAGKGRAAWNLESRGIDQRDRGAARREA